MRRKAKADDNQPLIVAALRRAGCTVQHLHTIGQGCPDILVGTLKNGIRVNLLVEIKDGNKTKSQRVLTPDETQWHENWRGQVCVVSSVDEALELVK